MKSIKTILAVVGGVAVLLLIILLLIPSDDNATEQGGNAIEPAENYYSDSNSHSTAPEHSGEVTHLSSAEFIRLVADYKNDKDTYIGDGPCVVDFFAEWCGPCKQLSPVIEQMAKKYAGKVKFYKVDIDQATEVSNAYGIQSIPTLFFCSGGDIHSITGAPYESELEDMIKQLL